MKKNENLKVDSGTIRKESVTPWLTQQTIFKQ